MKNTYKYYSILMGAIAGGSFRVLLSPYKKEKDGDLNKKRVKSTFDVCCYLRKYVGFENNLMVQDIRYKNLNQS